MLKFPKNFYWGAASASYQVEGDIYNNDWAYEAKVSKKVPVADTGPDHFHKYEEDFNLAKDLGHNCHRISLEWSRIEPYEGEYNLEAILHYERVIRSLHEKGLKPFITLWHFTIPEWLYKKGGLENADFPEIFSNYCKFVTSHLSRNGLCNNFTTINEPYVLASNGWFRGNWPPFKKSLFKLAYIHRQLEKSHIFAYEKIKENEEAHDLKIEVGIVKDNIYFHANKKNFLFYPINKIISGLIGWYWNLKFLNKIKKHTDFIGLNYYFHKEFGLFNKNKYQKNDMNWDLFPEGIYYKIIELKKYNKPIYVAEAGIADREDKYRAQYIKDLVKWMHKSVEDGADLRGYMYWSLTDNFEWALGYGERFGLIEINYDTKERKIRDSAYVLKDIAKNNGLEL